MAVFPKRIWDKRGLLEVIEGASRPINDIGGVPFEIKRVYWITAPPAWLPRFRNWVRRGDHAHKEVDQVFFCLRGQVGVHLRSKDSRDFILLAPGMGGVFISRMTWHHMMLERGSILLALASGYHDEKEYIRDLSEFHFLLGVQS